MSYSNKKCLITGGTGFIGSHLAETLITKGYLVTVVDCLRSRKKQNLNPKIKFLKLDICHSKFSDILKKEKPDILYHLAGPINLRREIDDPLFNNALNVFSGFKKMIDYCCHPNIQKFIFISSGGAIYSGARTVPTRENYTPHPSSLYGLANLFLEKLLEEYSKTHKLNYIILRLSNVYGPRQWESGVIPSFIKQALKHKPPIINSDGKQTRDFIYIDDVIRALLIASKTKKNGIFNVGSAQEISLNKLFKKIAEILNIKLSPKYRPYEERGARRNVLDITKIKKDMNWCPKTNINIGLQKTINYFKCL